MSFSGDLSRFNALTGQRLNDFRVGVSGEAFRSIVEGSELTGAPGQPVDQGILKPSWQMDIGTEVTTIDTYAPHALPNENGISPTGGAYIQKSPVGGRFSVALTVDNFDKIRDHVLDEVTC